VFATAWRRRFKRYPGDWIWPVLGLLIIAALAATVGILATNGSGSSAQTRAETQASVPLSAGTLSTSTETSTLPTESVPTTAPEQPPPPPPQSSNTLTEWPSGQDGWTIVLSSVPQNAGRAAAVDAGQKALNAGVSDVGILNSSEYSSLHAGYFVVFSGVFNSEADARSALDAAQGSYLQAYVREITQ
jgi:hypothetical protein